MFDMAIENEAIVNSLANCTLLGTANEMKPKNIAAIKMLLMITQYVFHCILVTRREKAILIVSELKYKSI